MSGHPQKPSSPSSSSKPTSSRVTPEAPTLHNTSPAEYQAFEETPQATTGQHLSSDPSNPAIVNIGSPSPHTSATQSSTAADNPSSSQPPSHQRPHSLPQRRTTLIMSSSASSPGNTSTAGSTSGSGSSNPSYQLPYAPFPYPMPASTRGSGHQNGKSK